MGIKIDIHNKFDIVVKDAKTGKIKNEYVGHNILLNQFWTRYISANNKTCLSYIHFGSGTTAPVSTNTKLTTPVGSKASANASTDTSKWSTEGLITVKKTCRLDAAEHVGSSISEVGFAYSSATTGNLVTHATIKDENGNPLTILKKDGDIIDIYATFYFKIGYVSADIEFCLFDGSTDKNLPAMLCCVHAFSGSTYAGFPYAGVSKMRTRQPNGTQSKATDYGVNRVLNIAFDTANKKVTYTIPDIVAGECNLAGGICSLAFLDAVIKVPTTNFSQPVIVKEVLGTGDGVTKDFETDFGYILSNGTFKVFVNDVEVSATAEYGQGLAKSNISPDIIYLNESLDAVGGNFGTTIAFENPYYTKYGISSINCRYTTIYTSDDAITWTQAAQRTSSTFADLEIPAENQSKRYFKCVSTSGTSMAVQYVTSTAFAAAKNVHLTEAPASGATVACTYQPDVIAKDSSHMLKNISIALTFNEYAPT